MPQSHCTRDLLQPLGDQKFRGGCRRLQEVAASSGTIRRLVPEQSPTSDCQLFCQLFVFGDRKYANHSPKGIGCNTLFLLATDSVAKNMEEVGDCSGTVRGLLGDCSGTGRRELAELYHDRRAVPEQSPSSPRTVPECSGTARGLTISRRQCARLSHAAEFPTLL